MEYIFKSQDLHLATKTTAIYIVATLMPAFSPNIIQSIFEFPISAFLKPSLERSELYLMHALSERFLALDQKDQARFIFWARDHASNGAEDIVCVWNRCAIQVLELVRCTFSKWEDPSLKSPFLDISYEPTQQKPF